MYLYSNPRDNGYGDEYEHDLVWMTITVTIATLCAAANCNDCGCDYVHPTPCTLHPTPYTLHPTPYTLHPAPCTLHPAPYTLHPQPAMIASAMGCTANSTNEDDSA